MLYFQVSVLPSRSTFNAFSIRKFFSSASSAWWTTHYLYFKTQLSVTGSLCWQFPPHFFSGQLSYLVHVSLILLFTINFRYMFWCLSLLGNLSWLFPTSISSQLGQGKFSEFLTHHVHTSDTALLYCNWGFLWAHLSPLLVCKFFKGRSPYSPLCP